MPTLTRVLGKHSVEADTVMGAEDFSFYQEKIPGAYLWLGVSNEAKGITGGTHTPDFDIDEDALVVGVKTMSTVLVDYLDKH